MAEIGNLVLRTVLTYFVVLVVMRVMGKREIGKLSIFDLVISVMIAEIAVISIVEPSKQMLHAFIPMAVLLAIQVGTSLLLLRFRALRSFFDGKPAIIIEKGQLNRDVMRKQRYNLEDLMAQLREQQIASVGDVEFAVLEPSGKLSIIKKDEAAGETGQNGAVKAEGGGAPERERRDGGAAAMRTRPERTASAQDADAGTMPFPPKFRFETLPVPLIMDGKVLDDNLEKLGKNRFWLRSELRGRGIRDLKDVFLCTVDHRGRMFVDSGRCPRS